MTTLWAWRRVPRASCGPPFPTALSPDVVTLPLPFPRACYFPHHHRSPPPPLLLVRRHQLPLDRHLCPPPFLLVCRCRLRIDSATAPTPRPAALPHQHPCLPLSQGRSLRCLLAP